ncbi:MAG TPA: DUF2141 domain-containing protein [Bacteroidales bacterium]|nr:DUF2141 domain-containing protein [Bacteroidales bacterium]HPI30387.1 DUF2141 domain-containing protein [Bacteroidales bacterium]HQP15906.1 DUF2141 domain-containing protein [Bacteroidales bacterium]
MSKLWFVLFLWLFLIQYFSFGQFNPNMMNDTNRPVIPGSKPVPPNLLLPKIDSVINRSITNHGLPIQPNPFSVAGDLMVVFDSLHGKLNIFVKNINKVMGTLNVAVFNSYASFLNNGPVFRGAIIPVTSKNMMIPFDSVPKGIYSIAVFHDEDANGYLNKNQLNIPLEGYGFSNNVLTNMGPPNYSQIKFPYSGKNKNITIYMTYFKFPK